MSVLAIIPARAGSKGIPGKNFRRLGDSPLNLTALAVGCGLGAGCQTVVTSDIASNAPSWVDVSASWLIRPPELAQDDTPMIDVVQHVLEQIPGPADQIIVLLQPTQPFRTPAHVRQAIALLRESGADSVVSVVELSKTHGPEFALRPDARGFLIPTWGGACDLMDLPKTRQEVAPAYIRDGTVYAFRRITVQRYKSIYGYDSAPLIIPPDETCELDTEADWDRVRDRWWRRGLQEQGLIRVECPTCHLRTWKPHA